MTSANAFTELCPGCFAEKGSVNICHHCGYDESLKRGSLVLAHRTLLHHGQYLIGKVLGKPGDFGITYLAFDTKLETRVAIKEYLPRDLAGRDGDRASINAHSAEDGEHFRYGLTQFLQEARTLAQFDHANIVRVRNFFEENGTAYLVMDYYDGLTLAGYLAQQPQGKLPEKAAVDILMPILDGLREVHAKNFLHRDIKPQNIYLTTGNRAILLDFGAARQAMGERSRSLSVVLSEGYAPYEQYHRRGKQGPWTDIYACAAVLFHAVAGEPPPPATERLHKDELDIAALGLSASLTKALQSGLATDHNKRPQRMKDFQALLLESGDPIKPTVVEQKQQRVDLPAPDKSVPSRPIEIASPTVDPGIKMVSIPAGRFTMGSNDGHSDEKPAHRVTIKAFELGATEVTQGQWKAVMGSNPSYFNTCGDNCPVEWVSWDDIQDFIQKLNQKTGQRYRLPSESEWEYACRAGAHTTTVAITTWTAQAGTTAIAAVKLTRSAANKPTPGA